MMEAMQQPAAPEQSFARGQLVAGRTVEMSRRGGGIYTFWRLCVYREPLAGGRHSVADAVSGMPATVNECRPAQEIFPWLEGASVLPLPQQEKDGEACPSKTEEREKP